MRLGRLHQTAALVALAALSTTGCTNDTGSEGGGAGRSSDGTGQAATDRGLAVGAMHVCAEAPDPPYAIDGDEGLTGFAVEVLRAIADELDLPIETTPIDVDGTGLEAVLDDCEVAVVTTPMSELDPALARSDPYLDIDQSLLVRVADAVAFSTLVGLRGQVIGAHAGTTGERYLQDHLPEGASMAAFPDEASASAALQRGQVAAVLGDTPVQEWRAARDGLTVTTQTITTGEQYAFVVRTDDPMGLAALDDGLARLSADGRLGELYDRWVTG
jgi:ABC-type amino acid transport substrate-binding protein